MLRQSLCLCTLLVLISCGQNQPIQQTYWNSKTYFESEAARHLQQHTRLKKELEFDQQKQLTFNDTANWLKELEPFLTIDLQKPAYSGRFTIDTVVINEDEFAVEYSAKETQTDLRNCVIVYRHGNISRVEARFGNKNSLYQSDKQFLYQPDSGYTISGYQLVRLGNPVHYTIKGLFVAP